jgi:hypothetical protein
MSSFQKRIKELDTKIKNEEHKIEHCRQMRRNADHFGDMQSCVEHEKALRFHVQNKECLERELDDIYERQAEMAQEEALQVKKSEARAREIKNIALGASIEAVLDRAFIFLEDGEFDRADAYFEAALDREPRNARAYIGKLCVELEVETEEKLSEHNKPLKDMSNFQKAVKFADAEYRLALEGYDKTIVARLEEEERQRQILIEKKARERVESKYSNLTEQLKNAKDKNDYQTLATAFESLKHKDSAELAKMCKAEYQRLMQEEEERKKRDKYNSLVQRMSEGVYEDEYANLERAFEMLGEYKDAPAKVRECKALYEIAVKNREEREKEEGYKALVYQMSQDLSEKQYLDIMAKFIDLGEYLDSATKCEDCQKLYMQAKEKRKERERQIKIQRGKEVKKQRKHREGEELKANIIKALPIAFHVIGALILLYGIFTTPTPIHSPIYGQITHAHNFLPIMLIIMTTHAVFLFLFIKKFGYDYKRRKSMFWLSAILSCVTIFLGFLGEEVITHISLSLAVGSISNFLILYGILTLITAIILKRRFL